MRRFVLLVGVALLTALLGAGCTQVSAGEPRPAGSVPYSESGGSTTERPREIRLDGEDPCALVPESDLSKFDIRQPGEARTSRETQSPACFYSGDHAAYFVRLEVTEGISVWLDGSRAAEVGEIDPVAGFPAITLTLDLFPNSCDVVVDVADDQYLTATTSPAQTEVPVSESCEIAHELAESAMNTLMES